MTRHLTFLFMLVSLFSFGSPALAAPIHDPATGYYTQPDQRILGELAFRYRQKAAEMRDLAARLELEAQLSANTKGETHRETQHARAMAVEAWRHAELADERASEYRRLLPHGQVY
jgi:hypothetical protein